MRARAGSGQSTVARALLVVLVVIAAFLVAPQTNAVAAAGTNSLKINEGLKAGQYLRSANGQYRATMQSDGNFVVYRPGGVAEWATGTSGAGNTIRLQSDGNLVVYTSGGTARWSSNTAPSRNVKLVMQNDGNLVLYSRGGLPLWSSRGGRTAYSQHILPTEGRLTSGKSLWSPGLRYRAVMQANGNFVVYRSDGVVQWSAGTNVAGSYLRMQADGNLVVYTSGGSARWSSSTAPSSHNTLVMQDDGNLVLYSKGGLPLWASRGGRTGFSQHVLPTEGRLTAGQALWSPNLQYTAVMQGDGNFVVYRAGGAAEWATGTNVAGSFLRMQADGNLVVYTSGGSPRWSSATAPSSSNVLIMQDDGNLVIYTAGSRAIWASRSAGSAPTPPSNTGGYPDADAVDCSAQHGIYSWCKNGAVYSSRGFAYRNCTDFAAWRKGMVWSQIQSGGSGHAYKWRQGWLDRGRAVGTTPRVGAIAWWGTSRGSGFGHVAVVIGVNADGTARVEQYNGDGKGTYSVVNTRAEAYLY
jgi:surface antigen